MQVMVWVCLFLGKLGCALSFSEPGGLLENSQTKWAKVGLSEKSYYQNLPDPGDYRHFPPQNATSCVNLKEWETP